MRKINKQLHLRMILPSILFLTGIIIIIIMAATQPEEGGHPVYINIIGIAGFFVPMLLSLFFFVRIYGKSMVISVLDRELNELKRHKEYYYGTINCKDEKNYLEAIAEELKEANYKDLSVEVNINYDDYRFFLRKHFWTLDSTNIHVHMAVTQTEDSKIKDFFNTVVEKELTLNYGEFKGSYCAIIAVCAVKGFNVSEQFLAHFNEQIYVRGIAVIKVLIDTDTNKVFVSRGGSITGRRGQRIVRKYILKAKSFKSCRGEFGQNGQKISELEKKLDELDFNSIFGDVTLNEDQNTYANSLNDGEVGFMGSETAQEGGIIFYKDNGRILYLFCDYDEDAKTFGIVGIKNMKWCMPVEKRIKKQEKTEITSKIVKYLDEQKIPYDFIEMFFSPENQEVLIGRHK